MKLTITTTMFTTGASLVILAVFYLITGTENIPVNTVLEIFGANILINIGIFFRYAKIEIRYFILDFIIDVSYITAVLVVFGIIFDWFLDVPLWLLVVMAAVIYLFVIIATVVKIKKDTKEINELLQNRSGGRGNGKRG